MNIWKISAALALSACLMLPSAWAESEAGSWSADYVFQQYFLPDEDDLDVHVLTLSSDAFTIEARYDYERRDSASLWLGHTFSFGEEWEFELTPMAGALMGSLHGAAPGFKADGNWRSLNIYSEMEYVFDFETREENYFYSWSEVTVGLTDWLSAGIVGNRTRAYTSSVELDRGPIVRFDFDRVSVSCTALNIDERPIFVLGVEVPLHTWLS